MKSIKTISEFNIEVFLKERSFFFFLILFLSLSPLLFFRFPGNDESYYLLETSNMANFLSKGTWIGTEAVGLHGFLFKLPVALIYTITGPSIFVATLFNIILSVLSCFLFFNILFKIFKSNIIAYGGVLLLFTNFLFIKTASTYLRETPSLFVTLLLLYLVQTKKPNIVIGLVLMLLFDAKEHSFFQILPGVFIWFCYSQFITKKKILEKIKSFFLDGILLIFPTLIYLYLMFFTQIIPVNMFAAYILGFIDKGFTKVISHFAPINAGKAIEDSAFLNFLNIHGIDAFKNIKFSYLTKIFQPGILNISVVPMFIAIPSILTAVVTLPSFFKERKDDFFVFLSLTMISSFIIFYFRTSLGRYVFTIIPSMIILFFYFLLFLDKKKQNIIMFITVIMTAVSLLFEYNFIIIKILINIFFIISMYIILKFNKKLCLPLFLFCSIYGLMTFTLGYRDYLNSNIKQVRMYGYCNEAKEISNHISLDSENVLFINLVKSTQNPPLDRLLRFYKQIHIMTPEWHWRLSEWVPAKKTLSVYNKHKLYEISLGNENVYHEFDDVKNSFEESVLTYKISNVYIIVSDFKTDNLKFRQEFYDYLLENKDFILEDTLQMKGKKILYFKNIGIL